MYTNHLDSPPAAPGAPVAGGVRLGCLAAPEIPISLGVAFFILSGVQYFVMAAGGSSLEIFGGAV